MPSVIGGGRGNRIVDSALKTAISLSMSSSRLLGMKPNYFLVEVPQKVVERNGLQRVSEAFLNSLVGLAAAGTVSDSFVLVVEPSTRVFGNKPDVVVMTKSEVEIEASLKEINSRVAVGLASVMFFPASKLVIDTFWGETIEYDSSFFFGRAKENELVLDVLGVSGSHGQVVCDSKGEWSIVDLSSTNGTMLNGGAVRGSAKLSPGDTVAVAHRTLFRVREIPSNTIEDFAPDKESVVSDGACLSQGKVTPGSGETDAEGTLRMEGRKGGADSTGATLSDDMIDRTVVMQRSRDVRRR